MIYLAIVVALFLSGISAYFSVLGFTALFPASFWPIIVMAGTLEIAKIIVAVWLHRYWKEIFLAVKLYLSASVLVLMLITSTGVFGYLSKAHIKYQIDIDTGTKQELQILDNQISAKQTELDSIEKELDTIDNSSSKFLNLSKKTSEVKEAIKQQLKTKTEKKNFSQKKTELIAELTELNEKKIKIESKLLIQEGEVGPIRYLADLLYGKASKEQLEHTIRYAILVLVLVLDPMAIVLLLGISSIYRKNDGRLAVGQRIFRKKRKRNVVILDKNDILKI